MTVEQFNELIALIEQVSGPFVAFSIIGFLALIGFMFFYFYDKSLKERNEFEKHKNVENNVKNHLKHVKALRYSNKRDSYNYYVDCLISELDELYNM